MIAVYPHVVDHCKATSGGLHRASHFVNLRGMAKTAPEYPEIGARLEALRKSQSDLSQKDWAMKHGWRETQYNNWETGVRRITVDDAQKLCSLYGLTLDFVYLGRRDGLSERVKNSL